MGSGSDLFSGTLEVLLLRAVAGGSVHGYAIGLWIRRGSKDVLSVGEGALYPALHRLVRKGLMSAKWGTTETGRRAKFYTLTDAGRTHMTVETQRLTTFSRAVMELLDEELG